MSLMLVALPLMVSAMACAHGELTVCTGNRCWRNGAGRLMAASKAQAAGRFTVRSVGCSGVCPKGAVSVCEGPTCRAPAMQLRASDDAEALSSSATAIAALVEGEAQQPNAPAEASLPSAPQHASASVAATLTGEADATPAATTPVGRTIRCEYCGAVLASRNKYYKHLRESPCGKQAVVAGLDLEAGRQHRQTKVALSVTYGPHSRAEQCASSEAEAELRMVLESHEDQANLTITSASSWQFRRSRLFLQRLPALEDVFVYASRGRSRLDAHATAAWLDEVNAALEARGSSARVLGREELHRDLAQLNAEQVCRRPVFCPCIGECWLAG